MSICTTCNTYVLYHLIPLVMDKTGLLKRSAALACDLAAAYLLACGLLHLFAPPFHWSVITFIWFSAALYFLLGHVLWKRSLFQYLFRMGIQGSHWRHLGVKAFFISLMPIVFSLLHQALTKIVFAAFPIGYDPLSQAIALNWLGENNSSLCCGAIWLLLLGTAETCCWLFSRKSLCEHLCKTRVVASESPVSKGAYTTCLLLFLLLLLYLPIHHRSLEKAHGFRAQDATPVFPPVSCLEKQRYVRAFREKKEDAKSCLMSMFQKYDIVFLLEREHPEYTQWDFFSQFILNDTFAEKVGSLCTEYGSCSMQQEADAFLGTVFDSDTSRHKAAARIIRQNSVWPSWYGRNIFDFFVRLQQYNSTKDSTHRIQWHLCDMPLPWEKVYSHPESYLESQRHRDYLMGMNIVRSYQKQQANDSLSDKMLVIVNSVHGIRGLLPEQRTAIDYVDAYFPRRVGVVYLPATAFGYFHILTNMHGSLWYDAAKEVGDCFAVPVKGTPLEQEYYAGTQSPKLRKTAKLSDKFDAFLFIGHPYRFLMDEDGYPYQFDGDFPKEFLLRSQLLGMAQEAEESLESYRQCKTPEHVSGHPYLFCFGYNRIYNGLYLLCTAVPLCVLLLLPLCRSIRRKKKKTAVSL